MKVEEKPEVPKSSLNSASYEQRDEQHMDGPDGCKTQHQKVIPNLVEIHYFSVFKRLV